MISRLLKSVLIIISLVSIVSLHSYESKAQNGLRGLMNETIANRVADTVTQVEEVEPPVIDEDSLYAIPVDRYDVKKIDTTTFVQRAVSVKKRKPAKTYEKVKDWDQYFNIRPDNAYKKEHILNEDFKVFGWHPHWMGSAYQNYNYSLLSVLAYFSYELDPKSGGYKTIHDWRTTHVVDSAHKHGTKVLLSVTNFGKSNNRTFLTSKVTIALPPIDFDHVYDFEELNKYIELYVIMGYEFYGVNSKVAGPVSPLESGSTWSDYNLQKALDEYKIEGLPLKKILMGLPYYGAEWETESLKLPSASKKFINYPMYRNIKRKYGENLPCCEDEESKDWVISNQIGGIGIWALGFDNGHDELWKLIAAKFALSGQEEVKSKFFGFFGKLKPKRLIRKAIRIGKNPSILLKNPRPLMRMFGALAGVSMIGFFLLYRYSHKLSRMFGIAIKGALILQIIALVALIFVAMKFAGTSQVIYLIVGFIIGGIII